ncbi:MAG: ATP-dependent DNA helicase [Acidimicrobiales bacterium]
MTYESVDAVLDRAVQIAIDTLDATARPAQRRLAHAVFNNLIAGGNLASEAPTGSGKSFAVGVPAMVLAATQQDRTVISTESLGLQSQLMEKDLPVMAQATKSLLGVEPTFAVLKGWSNYVCALAACGIAGEQVGLASNDPAAILEAFRTADVERTPLNTLVEWAMEQVVKHNSGDRATLRPSDFQMTDDLWGQVSTTPAECPSASRCPFGSVCLPQAAREQAGMADIIVTNHSMLAIQAATSAPIVVGNQSLGPINHLIVDEAHGLASTVRKQGAVSISAISLYEILRSVERSMDRPAKAKSLREAGMVLFRQFDHRTAAVLDTHTIAALPTDDTLEELFSTLTAWLKVARALVPDPYQTRVVTEMRSRFRALARISNVIETIAAIQRSPESYARWVEQGRGLRELPPGLESITGTTLKVSPVDVAPMLRNGVYECQATQPIDSPVEPIVMSVSAVSATLPQSFVYELGLQTIIVEYPSPFTRAYKNSMLYVPKLTVEGVGELSSNRSRVRFDTTRHAAWAAPRIASLVGANGGSALVLSATTAAGQLYADYLRQHCPGVTVHSQWDGGPIRYIVDTWRSDERSVLVGTRSLMTGVDAPGGTCSLVIIDRVPRAAGNPVDDARVKRIMDRMEIDRWAADRFVYVGDAALLMEQAAGRLIRSTSDVGMVACLDPRLLKSSPLKYPEPTRQMLIGALDRFVQKTSDRSAAEQFLVQQKLRTARKKKVAA